MTSSSQVQAEKLTKSLELQLSEVNAKLDESSRHQSGMQSNHSRTQSELHDLNQQLEEVESQASQLQKQKVQLQKQLEARAMRTPAREGGG